MKKLLLSVITLFIANVSIGQYAWNQKATMSTTRYGATGFSIGSKGYVCSGYNAQNQTLNDLWEWDQASNVWTQKASMSLTRSAATSFVVDGFAYVGLGYSAPNFRTDLQKYDASTNTWTAMASLPAQGRYGSASFVANDKGYITGGNMGSASGPFTNELWEYNPVTNQWTIKTNFPGIARYGGRAVSFNNNGYVFSGLNGTGNSSSMFFNDLWEYNPLLNNWSQKIDFPGIGRSYPSMFILDNKIAAGAGIHWTGALDDFYLYDPVSNTWGNLPSLPAGNSRWAGISFSIGNKGYVATGNQSISGNNQVDGELWEIALSTGLNDANQNGNVQFSLYPTLTTDFITIEIKSEIVQNYSYFITNTAGQLCSANEILNTRQQIYLSGLAQGQYIIYITDELNSVVSSRKFVIKND